MDILKRTGWQTEVRVKLLGEDNTTFLPDATLEVIAPKAERTIKTKFALWSATITAGGDNKDYLIDAAVSLVSAMYIPSLRVRIGNKEKLSDMSIERDIDFDKLEADLYAEVNASLTLISTNTATSTITRTGVIVNTAMYEALE